MKIYLILVSIFLLASTNVAFANGDFCTGYFEGFRDSYKEKYGNNPNPPNCPNLPNSADGQHWGNKAYKIGYRMGIRDGDKR